jgi:hypothetical protein
MVGIIGGIIAIVWIIFQMLTALWPPGPKLAVFEQTTEIGLPEAHLRFLQDMDMSRREDIRAIVAVAEAAKEQNKDTYGRSGTLDSLKEFSSTVPVLGPLQNSITTVKIINKGGKSANNVKVIFPSSGFASIQRDGSSTRTEQTEGRVELQSIEAGSRCVIRFWPKNYPGLEEIRVVSDEGIAAKSVPVETAGYRWIIGFGIPGLTVFAPVSVGNPPASWDFAEPSANGNG